MNNFFRALIAGYGAKKLGGGCLGTIIVFIIIWVALGQCSWTSSRAVPPPQTYPADRRALVIDPIWYRLPDDALQDNPIKEMSSQRTTGSRMRAGIRLISPIA
ncbi:MAG TPA: hypothetical protein VF490_06685 [Chryseosolibacter sp.]